MRACVVGSGIGGLAAAIRLAAKGHCTTLLEACPDLGGRARQFHCGDFAFDAGPTVITAPYLLESLFAQAGERLQDWVDMVPVEPVWYRFQFADGQTVDYGARPFFEEQIQQHFPQDIDGYRRLMRHAEEIFALGYEQLANTPFLRISHMLRQLPAILRLSGYRSVYGLVASYIRHERLRHILCTPPLLLGGSPYRASAIYFLIHVLEQRFGVHFVKGGTFQLIRAMAGLAEKRGVRIECGAEVEGFGWQHERIYEVQVKDRAAVPTDSVIWNGDALQLYRKLIPARNQSFHTRLRCKHYEPSMGLMVIYFSVQGQYPDIAHHTIGLGSQYRATIQSIFRQHQLPDEPAFYLHRPAATDPAMASQTAEPLYVLVPVPNLTKRQWDREAYDSLTRTVMHMLEQRLLPGLRDRLLHQHVVTPHYFQQQLHSTHGAGFSLAPNLTQSAWFRFPNRDPRIDNLYLCGAGTHPGAGVPGVLHSAAIVEALLT